MDHRVLFMCLIGLICLGIAGSQANKEPISFNVVDFGAKSDGETDSYQAFWYAWKAACNVSSSSEVIIPEKMTFRVNPIIFHGPCRAERINFKILGTIVGPPTPKEWDANDTSKWLVFNNVRGLRVDGHGTIDGRGKGWWDQSCRDHPQLEGCTKLAPTSMKFNLCNDTSLGNIYFTNSPNTHVSIKECQWFKVENLSIQSPGNSPNTDGIHIHATHNLVINNSNIGVGDDCISIGDSSSNLELNNIICGPGHGISIGSLGRNGNVVQVENISVSNCVLTKTTNGARIKTWQVGQGYVRGVTYKNMSFISVDNPIIIDQNYCDVRGKCNEKGNTGVHLSNISYREMYGTSSTQVAVNLNCSESVPCSEISMENIKLTSDKRGEKVTANCSHAYGEEDHEVIPGPCLLNQGNT